MGGACAHHAVANRPLVSGPRLRCLSVSCRTFKVYKKGDRSQSFACKEQNELTMDDYAREQLRDEVTAYYAVSGHTNIAGLVDVYINADPTCDANVWYLVMELCDGNAASSVLAALAPCRGALSRASIPRLRSVGGDLMTRIEIERSLCEARVIDLTRCMLTAIAHCNSLGVAHR